MASIPVPTAVLPPKAPPPTRGKKRKAEKKDPPEPPVQEARALPANGLIRTSTLLKQVKEHAEAEGVEMKVRRGFVEAFLKQTEENLRLSFKRARLNQRRTLMPADV